MTNKIDVETLLKHYTEGRISKQEFLRLHSLITQPQEDEEIELPHFPMVLAPVEHNEEQHGVFQFVKTYLRSIVAFTGSLSILSTLAINYYHNFGTAPPRHEPEAVVKTLESRQTDLDRYSDKQDIKSLANALLNDPIWNARTVNQFTSHWIAMSDIQQELARSDRWYKQFVDALKRQVRFELARRNDADTSSEPENRHRALMHLAVTLKLISLQNPPNTLAELDAMLSSESPASAPAAHAEISAHVVANNDAADNHDMSRVELAAVSVADNDIRRRVNEIIEKQDETVIGGPDIVKVMDQYVAAYHNGNPQQMVSLFADDTSLHQPLSLETVQTQYQGLFQNTDDREVKFSGLMWEQHDSEAKGKGQFHTTFRVKPDGEVKTLTTHVMLAMRKIDNVTRITDFELNDDSLFSVSPAEKTPVDTGAENPAFTPANPMDSEPEQTALLTPQSRHPSSAELHDIITQYVDSYRRGSVDRIMSLFASSNWTTAPEGLIELRHDYRELFQSTAERQMFITNMDWSFKDNKAMGTGDLVISLVSKENHKVTSKKGKVRIVVEKNQKPLISHLFQIVN